MRSDIMLTGPELQSSHEWVGSISQVIVILLMCLFRAYDLCHKSDPSTLLLYDDLSGEDQDKFLPTNSFQDGQKPGHRGPRPDDFCQPNRGMIGNVCLRPVGTRGGRGEGWGPGACPGGNASGLGCVRPTGLLPTRTSTRPPHPPCSAPCPYRMQDAPSPIRSATFIRTLGRKHLNG